MDRPVTPPKQVTSPTWGPPLPCRQALNEPAEYEELEPTQKWGGGNTIIDVSHERVAKSLE